MNIFTIQADMADVKIKELPTCIQREKKIGKKEIKKLK